MSWFAVIGGRYRVPDKPRRAERKVELAVVLLGLVLCLQLLYSGARFALLAAPATVAPAADALVVRDVRPLASVTAQQSEQMRARPLFWESRRPVSAKASAGKSSPAAGKATQLKGVSLLGVFGAGESAGVIVQVKDLKRRVLVGEKLEGWTLESVAPTEVVLAYGGKRETLRLQARNSAARASPAGVSRSRPARSGKSGKESVSRDERLR
jgi:hypothetical protein